MVSRTGTTKPGPPGTAILEQLAGLDAENLSPATARKLLEFRFDAPHHRRVEALSQKAQAGTLAPEEREELDEYIRVGTLLSVLQSRARGPSSVRRPKSRGINPPRCPRSGGS